MRRTTSNSTPKPDRLFRSQNAERFAIAEDNEAIAKPPRDKLPAAGGAVLGGMILTALMKTANGRHVQSFGTTTRLHDAAVHPRDLGPRQVTLDAKLGLSSSTTASASAAGAFRVPRAAQPTYRGEVPMAWGRRTCPRKLSHHRNSGSLL